MSTWTEGLQNAIEYMEKNLTEDIKVEDIAEKTYVSEFSLYGALITSNIVDMLSYLELQMKEQGYFKRCHESLIKINTSSKSYEAMGIHMDEIAMAWIINREHHIIWHNGGTDDYNCYMGFNVETQTGVIIISNLSPSYRIPATVLGVKLLTELK